MDDLGSVARDIDAINGLIRSAPNFMELTIVATQMRDLANLPVVIQLCRATAGSGKHCQVEFVLCADAAMGAVGRRPTSLSSVLSASRALVAEGVKVGWLIPLRSELIYRLETLFSLAEEEHVTAVLAPPSMLPAVHADFSPMLTPDDELFLRDFIEYRLLERDPHSIPPDLLAIYQALHDSRPIAQASSIAGESGLLARFEGPSQEWSFSIQPWTGSVMGIAGVNAKSPVQRKSLRSALRHMVDLGEVALDGSRAIFQWLRALSAAKPGRADGSRAQARLQRVLVIGAYGGEHIGDAAILGGVLFRMHRRHGTMQAILMSQRPRHSAHLIPMLATPVDVRVENYSQSTIRSLLQQVDAVVFAGGPLMDLPKQLVKHLHTVSLAKMLGKPFLIEGIGVGPFVRWPSVWAARRLVLMADRISVRTMTDSVASLLRGLDAIAGQDPAFDYLATRPQVLTKIAALDRQWLDQLLRDTKGRTLVGMNIRPIRHEYTEGADGTNLVQYTQEVEADFERRLADALIRFHESADVPPCFIFFPMNAIQFGMCDLRSAYRIARLLPSQVDFRIWEGDAGIDGVIALLRELDVAICMRFHAAIYALAQQLPVIGIDYRIGRKDKVGALLSDRGMSENCARIDELSSDWLLQRLCALTN